MTIPRNNQTTPTLHQNMCITYFLPRAPSVSVLEEAVPGDAGPPTDRKHLNTHRRPEQAQTGIVCFKTGAAGKLS